MKRVLLSVWIPDDAPVLPSGDYGRTPAAELATWAGTLAGLDHQPEIAQLTDKQVGEIGDAIAAHEYRDTVRGIVEDLRRAVSDGEIDDYDGAIEWIEQTIDGHHDVIYTHCAMEICRQSRNDGAYFEDFGSEGAISDGGIEWSKLAYAALRADVLEDLGDLSEWFECSECRGEVTAADHKIAGDNLPVCEDCRAEDSSDGDSGDGSPDDTGRG